MSQKLEIPDTQEVVPVIPEWIMGSGYLFIVPTAVAILWAIAHIGHADGADAGWGLFIFALCGTVAVWWRGYCHRLAASEALRDQALYQLHEMAKADAMTGRQFEVYCAALLRARGYRNVSITGSTDGDHGADIIATTPGGTRVAVQCKRWRISVGPEVVRGLIGAISSGKHRGRAGILMTNAPVTSGARNRAEEFGITVVDRPVLQQWMGEARSEIKQRGHAPQMRDPEKPEPQIPDRAADIDNPQQLMAFRSSCRPGGMRPAARVMTGVLCSALILLIIVIFPPDVPKTPLTVEKLDSPSVVSASGVVVKEFYAAINRHDWRTVWRLWYHPSAGYGPGYHKMISGYQLTARDVVTSLKTNGDAVSIRVLAYETTGAIQSYDLRYKVHNGKITWGHGVLLKISHPQQKAVPAPTPSS
jgi:restriction system protein